ncbi:Response regulator receiver domain-containing protein [Flavobacterium glycines]|uniref:Histidine kinase n=1 Tax=Flavobacterium glycines TaxID=551990 RepID=A0A1B9DGB1_9FLAO|nr:response regulator [Flavobacterium glycines]OCB68752.1 histidine kinase [Flavobacterium glycines]GEL11379.1 response regulator [Flavobacterium glycines]SDJ66948.1 Response regulator receiver domain-containing protein [Flavobacterium glycines]
MLDLILCVDDDPITLMLCKKVITKASFSNNIITAKNGEEAIQYFDSILNKETDKLPQLVFLDLNMPVMDGWDFLNIFNTPKYSEVTTKIVVLSSTIDPEDHQKSKNFPMVIDFLSKPITNEMLNYLQTKFEE